MLKLNVEVKRCMKCGKDNTFLTQADIHEYGVWIARNQNSSCYSWVQLIDNPVFDEFLDLIRIACSEHNIADYKKYLQPSITQDVFPIACDQIDGDYVSFRDCPRVCRYCGSKEFVRGLSEPLYTMEVNTFEVTYDSWKACFKLLHGIISLPTTSRRSTYLLLTLEIMLLIMLKS